jgi:hypothetical protein
VIAGERDLAHHWAKPSPLTAASPELVRRFYRSGETFSEIA